MMFAGQTYDVCFQILSYLDALNILRILFSFLFHVACRVNINSKT